MAAVGTPVAWGVVSNQERRQGRILTVENEVTDLQTQSIGRFVARSDLLANHTIDSTTSAASGTTGGAYARFGDPLASTDVTKRNDVRLSGGLPTDRAMLMFPLLASAAQDVFVAPRPGFYHIDFVLTLQMPLNTQARAVIMVERNMETMVAEDARCFVHPNMSASSALQNICIVGSDTVQLATGDSLYVAIKQSNNLVYVRGRDGATNNNLTSEDLGSIQSGMTITLL